MNGRVAVGAGLLAVCVAAAFPTSVRAANDLSLNVDPATECVSVGQTITVTLEIANLGGVAINGVQARLNYDNTVMTLVNITPEVVVGPPANGWVEVNEVDNSGDVDWAAVINGGSILTAHVIATMTFQAIADGTASVTFRPDAPPLITKLTRASDSTTITPTTWDTGDDFDGDTVGDAYVGPPDCTITADPAVCADSTGNLASVPDAGIGAIYSWGITGGSITGGLGTQQITYTAGAGATVTLDVTVTDANGCSDSCQSIVTINPLPDATITTAGTVCANATGVTASVPNAGGGAIYSWGISGGSITAGLGTEQITYTAGTGPNVVIDVTVEDGNGCISSSQAIVPVSAPDCTITADDEVCASTTGHIASVPAAGGGATYIWGISGGTITGGAGTQQITYSAGVGPTITLDVTVIAGDSCQSDCQKIITVNDNPTADAGSDVTLCADASDPTVGGAPTASGGTAPYGYQWSGSGLSFLSDPNVANPTFDVAGAGPGSYQVCVTVTDNNTCVSAVDCAAVTINALPVADAGADQAVCADDADPIVGGSPTGSGGTGPYSYAWSGTGLAFLSSSTAANPTFDVAGAGPGSYQVCVTVTDSNTCASTVDCATVTVNTLPTADAGVDLTVCADAADFPVGGSPTGSGGTGPYTYAWSGTGVSFLSSATAANPTFDVAGAGPGSYQVCVTVTDSNLCDSAIDCATITIDALPVADAGADITLCGDAADPTVGGSPTASGGLGPYSYLWNGTDAGFLSSTTASNPTFDVAGAGPGSYQVCVTVTDSNLCVSATDCVDITINDVPVATAGPDLALCEDAADPSLGGSPTATGGTGPYGYLWTGDTIYLSATNVANPTFDVTAAGVGSYQACVTVTDVNTCVSVQDCADITINIVLDCTITTPGAVCTGTQHSAVVGNAGVGATYDWTVTGGTQDTPDDFDTIDYTAGGGPTVTIDITVTDVNACSNTCQTIVTVNQNPSANAGADVAVCADDPDPAVGGAPTASGGTGPYTYNWTGSGAIYLSDAFAANPTFDVLTAGPGVYDVCVDVTDVNTCVATQDCATVTVNDLPIADAGADVVVCDNDADPSVGGAPTGSGGTGPYGYNWSGSGATYLSSISAANPTFDVATAPPGVYNVCVDVTDANLCTSLIDCATVTVNDVPLADAGSDIALCADAADPTVGGAPTASGGTGPYTYSWSGTGSAFLSSGTVANPTFDVAGAGPGVHQVCVAVTDSNLCTSSIDCADVTVNALPGCTISAPSSVCGTTGGHVASAPAGLVSYNWGIAGGTIDTGQGTDSITFTAGTGPDVTLSVTVQDANGCINTCQQIVPVNYPDCTISADDSVCYVSTGNLATAPAGAVSYTWIVTGGTKTSQIGNSITYTAGSGTQLTLEVTVQDSNGCLNTCQKIVTILQPSIDLTVELEAVSNVVTRGLDLDITECGGSVDSRTLPVTTNAGGVGLITIPSVSPNAEWISVQEGHGLRRLAPVTFGACYVATVDLTGASRLIAGDFQTATVFQDNLVDISDFSILASRWNTAVDPNLSTGADATGDGMQNNADFTAIQVNFFQIGEAVDGCVGGLIEADDGPTRVGDRLAAVPRAARTPRASISTGGLTFPNARAADINNDGVVDAQDIRAFARINNLDLLPEFVKQLDRVESKSGRASRRTR